MSNNHRKTRKKVAYFVVIGSRQVDGNFELTIVRSTRSEGFSVSNMVVCGDIYKKYVSLPGIGRKKGNWDYSGDADKKQIPFLMKAKLRKVWRRNQEDKRYDILISPLEPDRVCKVVTPFLRDYNCSLDKINQ